MKKALQYIIPIAVAALVVWFILKNVDPAKIWENIQAADPFWVIVIVVVTLLSHLSRAYRWKLLMQPIGYNPSLRNTFIAVMTGYFGNVFIPRGGEVMRSGVLSRTDNIPFSSSFATVIAERVFDLLCLLTLIGASFLFEYDRFMLLLKKKSEFQSSQPVESASSNLIWWVLIGLILIAILAVIIFRKKIKELNVVAKVKKFVIDLFSSAFNSFRQLKNKKEFILHTFLIWLGYYLMTYLAFFCLPATAGLSPAAGLVMLVVGGLGMSVPSSGGIGPFHYFVATAMLLFYGIAQEPSIAYAAILHAVPFITVVMVGGICVITSFYIKPKDSAIKKPEDSL